jgi:hypothetical protein
MAGDCNGDGIVDGWSGLLLVWKEKMSPSESAGFAEDASFIIGWNLFEVTVYCQLKTGMEAYGSARFMGGGGLSLKI